MRTPFLHTIFNTKSMLKHMNVMYNNKKLIYVVHIVCMCVAPNAKQRRRFV